jgi:hypothetical protein
MTHNRILVAGSRLAAWIVIWTSVSCRASDATCASDDAGRASRARPIVGAVRFDAWQPGATGDPYIGFLGPAQWRYRLPFYGVEVDSNTVALAANTQAVMDQEIAYAHAAGLDFFCFDHYLTELRQSLNLYLSSAHKHDINFCLQMGALFPARVADAVNLIKTEPTYQKIAGGRPLVFLQAWYLDGYTPPERKATVDDFRAQVMQAGLPNPYIVVENASASSAAADADRYGADAISSYAMGVRQDSAGQPFSRLAENAEQDWNAYKSTGKKVVPTVMTGWDTRPDPSRVAEPYWGQATPQEIATHLQNALRWIAANPCATEANTIQIYAWNEISEGGWLLPSNPAFNPVGTGRLDAITAVLRDSASGSQRAGCSSTVPNSAAGTCSLSSKSTTNPVAPGSIEQRE